MGTILTSRQADELHKSIIAYLSANNMTNAAAAVREDVNLSEGVFDSATAKKYETLLEKKWTGIVRLQKKVMELEARCAALQTELDTALPLSLTKRNTDPASWLPRSPPRHSLESHRGSINCIAFHPIFSSLASGSEDYSIKIWDWELGELEQTLKGHTRAVLGVDYGGPKGGVLLASCSSDSTIKLWDPANGYRNIRTLPGHDHSVSAVRFTSSGDRLISASGDKSLKVWEVSTGYCVRTLQGHTGWVRDVYPSYDDRFIMSASSDQTARLWDVSAVNPESTAKLVLAGHENGINCCALAPPSSYQHLSKMAGQKKPPLASSAAEYLATGSRDKTIKLWDARGTCIKTLIGHDNWLSALVFHPGGKYLLSVADDRTLRCWDLSQEGKCVKVLADFHTQFITCLRWAPGITKEPSEGDGGAGGGQGNEASGTPRKAGAPDVQIRCVIATGSVDMTVKLFAN